MGGITGLEPVVTTILSNGRVPSPSPSSSRQARVFADRSTEVTSQRMYMVAPSSARAAGEE